MTSVAVSPDGRWLAVGGWKEGGVRVWDLPGRRFERFVRSNDPVSDISTVVGFSPDGQWLLSRTNSDLAQRLQFWRTGTWEPGQRADLECHGGAFHAPVFSADGQLMALGIAGDQVLLADATTGRELVRLTTLRPVGPMPLAFSPDGTKLVAGTLQKTALVWDLRQIRDELASRGLDWGAPRYPATPAEAIAGVLPPPLRVRVVGEVLETQVRRQAERALMDRRLGDNADDAEALIHRGWLSLTERRLPEAIADLDHLRRLQPDYADIDGMLGQAYQDTGNLAGALACYSRVLERAPEDQDTRLQRGLLALAIGFTQRAAEDFDEVLTVDPMRDLARYHRARALSRLGRFREALTDLDALIMRNPTDFVLYQFRGVAHDALNDYESARGDREKMRLLLPKIPNQLNIQAWGLVTGSLLQRDPERALVFARQAVALAPNESQYLNTLGVALYRGRRYAEAVDVLQRSLETSRGAIDAFDLFFLAMAHHELGRPARARTCFERAINWCEANEKGMPWNVVELTAFRAEAEAVLAGPGGGLPADVFAPR